MEPDLTSKVNIKRKHYSRKVRNVSQQGEGSEPVPGDGLCRPGQRSGFADRCAGFKYFKVLVAQCSKLYSMRDILQAVSMRDILQAVLFQLADFIARTTYCRLPPSDAVAAFDRFP